MEKVKELTKVLNQYFGSNVYPSDITDKYIFMSVNISHPEIVKKTKAMYKSEGFTIKTKTTSLGTFIKGIKNK